MKEINWITFCSQTGSEIVNICKNLQIKPYYIVTNNHGKLSESSLDFFRQNNITMILISSNPTEDDYEDIVLDNTTLVTLNGWLRIIPKSFIQQNKNIYNGHPGLITRYPELKGLHPQQKAFNLKHLTIGSVVHKVIEQVDEGEIVEESKITLTEHPSLEEYYIALKQTSLSAWLKFFDNYLK